MKIVVDLRLWQSSHLVICGFCFLRHSRSPQKENDNLSLSPISDLGLLYTLPSHRKLVSFSLISVQETIHKSSPPHQQAASLITSACRCFSFQTCFTEAGFWRQGSSRWFVHGAQAFGWTQSSCKSLRHHGCTTSSISLLWMTVGVGRLPRVLELSLPHQLLPRILQSQVKFT